MPLTRATNGGSASVPVGRTAFVDAAIGSDVTGIGGRADKPFLTVAAALAAAIAMTGGGADVAVKMSIGTYNLPGGAGGLQVDGTATGGAHIHFIGQGKFTTTMSGEITGVNSAVFHLQSLLLSDKITLASLSGVFLDRDLLLGPGIANNIVMPNTCIAVVFGDDVEFGGTNCISVSGGTFELQMRGTARTLGTLGANVTIDQPLLFSRPDNFQTGVAYTFVKEDAGITVHLNNAAAITATVPASLGAGFFCNVMQNGAGQVTFVASGVTLNSYGSLLKIAGQHGTATLKATAANVLNLSGALTA